MAKTKRDPAYYREYRRNKKAKKQRDERLVVTGSVSGDAGLDIDEGVAWIQKELIVPSGILAGKPFTLDEWQDDWVRSAYGKGIREAGLSIARKNGKSGLIAVVFITHLIGPWNRTDWRAYCASLTGALARELRDAIEIILKASNKEDQVRILRAPPPGSVIGKNGATATFLAADKASGHAVGSDLAIIDEAGLLQENKRSLWNALYSSISGRDGRFWAISIQGDGPMFEEMESRSVSRSVHWKKWSSPENCKIDVEEHWRAANPGLESGIKSIEYMQDAADRAKSSPGNEMHFRAYDLNQRVDPAREVIVSLTDYSKCVQDYPPDMAGNIVLGIDLGGSTSMTAATALNMDNGRVITRGAFGNDPPISKRSQSDRMGSMYDRMIRERELWLYPGKVTPVVLFLRDLFEELNDLGCVVRGVGFDRHRRAEAEMAMQDAGIPYCAVHYRGQGASATADGSHDIRAFQRLIYKKILITHGSTMLESAIASSVLRFDGAGNPALNKAANNARIDALSAAVIAAGLNEVVNPPKRFGVHIV